MKPRLRRLLKAQIASAECSRCRTKGLRLDSEFGVVWVRCPSCWTRWTPYDAATLKGFFAGARPWRFHAGPTTEDA